MVVKEDGATWRSTRTDGGGCLYDYASHTIDLVNFLLGRPVTVSGTQLKTVFSKNVEDAVYATITLESGASGQLSVNWSDETHRKMNTQITAIGKKGKMIADATELKIYLMGDNPSLRLKKGWTIKNITELTNSVDFYLRGEEYSAQTDYFIECIKSKARENKNSFENACQTDELINLLLTDDATNN